jgi:hypothetical protein
MGRFVLEGLVGEQVNVARLGFISKLVVKFPVPNGAAHRAQLSFVIGLNDIKAFSCIANEVQEFVLNDPQTLHALHYLAILSAEHLLCLVGATAWDERHDLAGFRLWILGLLLRRGCEVDSEAGFGLVFIFLLRHLEFTLKLSALLLLALQVRLHLQKPRQEHFETDGHAKHLLQRTRIRQRAQPERQVNEGVEWIPKMCFWLTLSARYTLS